jgi:ureidoglycolate lyase
VTTSDGTRIIKASPLTRAGFVEYGDVIETDGAAQFMINAGRATRFDDLAVVDTTEAGGLPAISIFRSEPVPQPVVLSVMERHPWASQAIIPMDGATCLVVVAPAGSFDPTRICAFLAGPHQGVNYRRGVWHHPLLALGQGGDFLVVDRKGPGENCDLVDLDPIMRITVILPDAAARRSHQASTLNQSEESDS